MQKSVLFPGAGITGEVLKASVTTLRRSFPQSTNSWHKKTTSAHMSRYFEEQHLAKALNQNQLFTNICKNSNRIRQFELSGKIGKVLFEKLGGTLNIDTPTIDRLIEQDRLAFLELWLEWVNQPITPHLVQRLIPGV